MDLVQDKNLVSKKSKFLGSGLGPREQHSGRAAKKSHAFALDPVQKVNRLFDQKMPERFKYKRCSGICHIPRHYAAFLQRISFRKQPRRATRLLMIEQARLAIYYRCLSIVGLQG
jgi:hypothetical protein